VLPQSSNARAVWNTLQNSQLSLLQLRRQPVRKRLRCAAPSTQESHCFATTVHLPKTDEKEANLMSYQDFVQLTQEKQSTSGAAS